MNTHPQKNIQNQTGVVKKMSPSDFLPFQNFIAEKTGIYIKPSQLPKLEFAIKEQMLKRNLSSPDTYFKDLVLNQKDFYHLVERLTVNETYFLREPAYMKLFSGRLVPELLSSKQDMETVKIVSAGCSTGPEPYSLAMMLMEKYGSNCGHLFSIIGFDIDQYALLQAQKGVYGQYSFRNFDPDLKKMYFQSLGRGRYQIKAEVQKMVDFLHHNLMSNDYPPCLNCVDIIFYRNVSIYFDPPKQKLVFKKLLRLLNPGGYIITSSTEVHGHEFDIISSKEIDGMFIFCKSGDQHQAGSTGKITNKKNTKPFQPETPFKHRPHKPKKALSQLLKKNNGMKGSKSGNNKPAELLPNTNAVFRKASGHVQTKNYDKALELLDSLITAIPDFIKAWTLKAAILMNRDDLAGAKLLCIKAIEKDPLCFEGYLLAGLIARLENDPSEAIKRFKESLYIDPLSWLSHFYLAEVFRTKGDLTKAILEYQTVIRHLQKHGADIQGPAFPYISFTASQVRHLCDHNIAQLKNS